MTFSPFRHISSVLWKRRPIHLTFFVTRRCNASCSFCFYRGGGSSDPDSGPELSPEEVDRISSSLGDLLWLAFSGGEVFLRPDLVELAEIFYRNNRPAIILLPTNGLLPAMVREKTEAILERCPKSSVVVKLSVDGPREVHDSLRGVRGAFDATLTTYDMLKGLLARYRNFELGVNTVFCAANQERIDETIDFIGKLDGIRTHTVSLIRGRVPKPSLKDIDRARYRDAIERLESAAGGNRSLRYRFRGGRLKAAQDILQRRLIYETGAGAVPPLPCYAGLLSLVLDEQGNVFPCEILAKAMGNVRESGYDIRKVLANGTARQIISSIRSGDCSCTHECNFMMNIFFNPRLYPALLREYARLPR